MGHRDQGGREGTAAEKHKDGAMALLLGETSVWPEVEPGDRPRGTAYWSLQGHKSMAKTKSRLCGTGYRAFKREHDPKKLKSVKFTCLRIPPLNVSIPLPLSSSELHTMAYPSQKYISFIFCCSSRIMGDHFFWGV